MATVFSLVILISYLFILYLAIGIHGWIALIGIVVTSIFGFVVGYLNLEKIFSNFINSLVEEIDRKQYFLDYMNDELEKYSTVNAMLYKGFLKLAKLFMSVVALVVLLAFLMSPFFISSVLNFDPDYDWSAFTAIFLTFFFGIFIGGFTKEREKSADNSME